MSEEKIGKCCFIGEFSENIKTEENEVKRLLRLAVRDALFEGYKSFVTPVTRGAGLLAAEIVVEFKTKRQGIKLICVQPYDYFGKAQEWKWNVKHKRVTGIADSIVTVSSRKNINCYVLCDRWVINNGEKLIAVCSGSSETGKSVDYAAAKGLTIKKIEV